MAFDFLIIFKIKIFKIIYRKKITDDDKHNETYCRYIIHFISYNIKITLNNFFINFLEYYDIILTLVLCRWNRKTRNLV